jgi:predicted heme/steroid binding protein/uncharacterized membrane protein
MPKDLTTEELSRCDGKEGRPVYICHKGRIIDVSQSPLWAGGLHMDRHTAGRDLTNDIEAAPHGLDVLDRYPEVARLIETPRAGTHLPPYLAVLLDRYPFLRRQPHPMSIHFPIVFVLSATFFSLLFLATGNGSFDQTAFYCLIGALILTPPAVVTGLAAWWINYMGRPMRAAIVKMALSFVLLPLLFVIVAWRAIDPAVLHNPSGTGLLYLALVLLISPIVIVIAHFGGSLIFPTHKT